MAATKSRKMVRFNISGARNTFIGQVVANVDDKLLVKAPDHKGNMMYWDVEPSRVLEEWEEKDVE